MQNQTQHILNNIALPPSRMYPRDRRMSQGEISILTVHYINTGK